MFVLAKVVKSVLGNQISDYFGLFTTSQFEFMKFKCTAQALDSLIGEIITIFENNAGTQVTFCGLTKAFYSTDHNLLINKLQYCG